MNNKINSARLYLAFLTSLSLISTFGILGCTHNEIQGAEVGTRLDASSYADIIKKYTQHDVRYEGMYNKFEIYATFINTEMQAAKLQKMSDIYQWDIKKAQSERERLFQENSSETKFVISFYVPTGRLNDLNKASSGWKLYLESNGQRYEGHAVRSGQKLEDIQALWPYHNRWSTSYEITFSVPMTAVEKSPVTFIITGSQGKSILKY
jgi:hypothetical protein